MFECDPMEIPGVLLIRPSVWRDDRGFFLETYHAREFARLGIHDRFVQDNRSCSVRHTLRGLHYQVGRPQAKLCSVVRGAALDVAVDVRRGSPSFGRWVSAVLTEENKHQMYVPIGFAHGFLALADHTELLYKCSDFYDPLAEQGIFWADPDLAINWGTERPLLSDKDARNPPLARIAPDRLG